MSSAPSPSDFDWSAATIYPHKWRKQPLKSLGKYINKKAAKRKSGSDGDAHTEAGGATPRSKSSTELYLRQLSIDDDDGSQYDDEKGLVAAMQSDMIDTDDEHDLDDLPSKSQESFLDTYEDTVEELKKPSSMTRKPVGRNHSNLKQVGKAAKTFLAKRITKWRDKECGGDATTSSEAAVETSERTASVTTSTAYDSGGMEETSPSPTPPPSSKSLAISPKVLVAEETDKAMPLQSIMDPSAPLQPPKEDASVHSVTIQSLFAPSAHSRSTTYSYNMSQDSNITTKAGNIVGNGDDSEAEGTVREHVQFKVKTESFVAPTLPREKLPERKPSKPPSEEETRRFRNRPSRKPGHRGSSRSRSRSKTRKNHSRDMHRSKSKDRTEEEDVLGDLRMTLKRKSSISRSSRTLNVEAMGQPQSPTGLKRKVSLDRSIKSLQVDAYSSRTHQRMTKHSPGQLEQHLSPRRKLSLNKDKKRSSDANNVLSPRRTNSIKSAATTGVLNTPRDKKRSIESQHHKRHGRSKDRPTTSLEAKLEQKSPIQEDCEKSVGSRVSRSKSSDHVREMVAALSSTKKKPLRRSSSFSSADQSGRNDRSKAVEYTPNTLKKLAYRSPLDATPISDKKKVSPKPFIKRSKHSLIKEHGESAFEQSKRIYRQEMEEALNNSSGTVKSSEEQKKPTSESRRRRERRRPLGTKSHSPTRERLSGSHRKGQRYSTSRSHSHDKAIIPSQHANLRGRVHHTHSQELWLTQTPKPAPTQTIGVDLKRVPHTDGKTREKYHISGDTENLRSPKLDSSNKTSRRGTRSGKPSKSKSTSTRGTSTRHRSTSPGKLISPSSRRRHHGNRSRSRSHSRDRTLPAAPNLNDLDGH